MNTQAEREAYALALIARRVLRVDRAGRIWRIGRILPGGAVRSHQPRRAERPSRNGYLRVIFRAGDKTPSVMAHRLVYLHYKGTIPAEHEVNHDDFDRRNNKPGNLKAVTEIENQNMRGGSITEREWIQAAAEVWY